MRTKTILQATDGTQFADVNILTVPVGAIGANGNIDVAAALALKQNATRSVNAQTDTTYTLQASDLGKRVTMNNAASNTLTCPDTLGLGFWCEIEGINASAGALDIGVSGTATLEYDSNFGPTTAAQYSVVQIFYRTATNVSASGQLGTP